MKFIVLTLCLFAMPSYGAVVLSFAGSSVPVSVGSTFDVNLFLTNGSEQVSALDYYVRSSSPNAFRLVGRDTSSSELPDLLKSNVGDNGLNAGVLDIGSSLLTPRNAIDLGGSVNNVNIPLLSGTHSVAKLTFRVEPGTPAGPYLLTTDDLPGFGYVTAAPNLSDVSFDQHATFTVVVAATPEPSCLALMGVVAVLLTRRRNARHTLNVNV